MKLRVGLVGLGAAWETRHRPAFRALADRFDVRAVCDQVSRRAELAAGEFGAVTVDGFRAMAAREDLDAIFLLSTRWYGTLPVLAACESGKAVYFGAGMDLPADEAQHIRDKVRQAGIAFTAEFPRRFSPATLRLKELIATRLGSPRLLFCHQRLLVEPDRRGPPETCHPSIKQQLVELVDWCRYVVDEEPTWVTGMLHRSDRQRDGDDYQMMSLGFSSNGDPGDGPVAQISCGHYIPARWPEAVTYRPLAAMQACCERGIAFVDLPATLLWFDEAGRHQESLQSERPVGEQLLMHFYRSVTSLVTKTCDLDDACRALWIVDQARRSHAEGRRIQI